MDEKYLVVATETLEELANNPTARKDIADLIRSGIRTARPDPTFQHAFGMLDDKVEIYNPTLLIKYFPELKEEIPVKWKTF